MTQYDLHSKIATTLPQYSFKASQDLALAGHTYDGNPACVNKEALTTHWVSDLWIKTDEVML